MISKSMMLADAVLAMVDFLSGDLNLYLEPYQNGREHGWALQKFGDILSRKVAFSQDRHSDRIVLYVGTNSHFSMQGNTPSDRAWEKREFLNSGLVFECAKIIIEYFIKE